MFVAIHSKILDVDTFKLSPLGELYKDPCGERYHFFFSNGVKEAFLTRLVNL